jgi:hypothetical protein
VRHDDEMRNLVDQTVKRFGTLAGLFSAILTALLMITYFMHPGEKRP